MEEAFARLLKKGNSLAIVGKMMQFGKLAKVVGLEDKYRLDENTFSKEVTYHDRRGNYFKYSSGCGCGNLFYQSGNH